MFDNVVIRIGVGILIGTIVLGIILSVLPVYVMPEAVGLAIDWLFETLWAFNFVLPVATMLQVFGLILLIELLFITIKFILFLKKLFVKSAN